MPTGAGLLVSTEGYTPTFRYCKLGFTPVATPTDWLIIQGGTRPARIKSIKFTGVATANGTMPVQLIRRSTAGTLGSAVLTAIPAALHDIGGGTLTAGDGVATATVSTVGTANYTTLGTQNPTGGVLCVDRLSLATTATGLPTEQVKWDFAFHEDKSLYLRGVSDFICINGNGAAVPAGAAIDVEIEMEEGQF